MTYAEFQAHWEREAASEYDGYLAQPAAALVAEVRARRYGEYYQLWRAVAARATLDQAGNLLLEVLRRNEPYLVRYHAASALLALLGTKEFDPVELSAEARPEIAANLEAVETLLRRRLANPPPPEDLTGT
jgi:hypothetical protein